MAKTPHCEVGEPDATWLKEWSAFGLRELEAHLELHARFEQYLVEHAGDEQQR